MAPVPCREGMDAEAKAPCVGAVRCVLEQTMSTDKLVSPWEDLDCPSDVSSSSSLSFCCSVVSRWKGCIPLQKQKSSYKRNEVKWSELCSSSVPFNHSVQRSQGENAALFPGGSLGSESFIPPKVISLICGAAFVFLSSKGTWHNGLLSPAAAEITQCLCSTAARR